MHKAWICGLVMPLVVIGMAAWGQNAAPTDVVTSKFEVVSIKPNKGGTISMIGTLPTGFQAINASLSWTISMAYLSQDLTSSATKIVGEPDWAKNDKYDVVAKLTDETIDAWKNLTPKQRQEKVRPLLQAILAERCKMTAHTEPAEVAGYALVVGRSGPKLKDADPNVVRPSPIVSLPDGGQMQPNLGGTSHRVRFFGATMKSVAASLRGATGAIIEDRTGLTGRYDFDLPIRDRDEQETGSPLPPPGLMQIDALGLELKPIKVRAENLVIDHIDRPSEN